MWNNFVMKKKKAIKIFCLVIVLYQAFQIVSSVINLIYCFISGSTYLFPTSNVAWFVPQYYISNGQGLWNAVILALFIGITVFLYVKSSRLLLSDSTKINPIVAINAAWFGLCQLMYSLFFCLHILPEHAPYYSLLNYGLNAFILIVYLVIILCKYNYSDEIKNNLKVTTYKQVKGYAVGNCLIAAFALIFDYWMHYFADMPLSNPTSHDMFSLDALLLFVWVTANLICFIITVVYYFYVKKIGKDTVPCKHFLLKISLLQIAAIIIEIVGILLAAFVLF